MARFRGDGKVVLVLHNVRSRVPRPHVRVTVVPRLGYGIELETARDPRLIRRQSIFRRTSLRLFQSSLLTRSQILNQNYEIT